MLRLLGRWALIQLQSAYSLMCKSSCTRCRLRVATVVRTPIGVKSVRRVAVRSASTTVYAATSLPVVSTLATVVVVGGVIAVWMAGAMRVALVRIAATLAVVVVSAFMRAVSVAVSQSQT